MENYKVFTISFTPFNIDLVSGLMWNLAIDGITEEENSIKLYSKESNGLNLLSISELLDSLVTQNLLERHEITEGIEEQQNWNEYWEKNVNVIRMTDRIIIKPTFREYIAQPEDVVILIDPKMSFGTGEHETTKLCVQAVEDFISPDVKALDLGSGTGILAIVAVKLGAKKVYAVDNDEWCLLNGKENVSLNKVDEKVEVVLGEIENVSEEDFDFVIANINKNVLLGLGDKISAKMIKAGKLILSGFYTNDYEELTKYYENFGLSLLKEYQLNNWAALVFIKN